MQLHQANTLERIESAGDEGSSDVITQPATGEPWDFSNPNGDEILALLKPEGDRKRPIWLVASALVAGFASGWAGGFSWYGPANISALNPITQAETPSRRMAETKSGGKSEGARKTASTLGLRTPSGASQVSAVAASISAKPLAALSDGAHLSVDSSSTASPAIQADMTPTGSIAPRGPFMPAPETRPTTIEGWTVLDVRGGTAVLGGPDGIRMATRGDIVPGIGRIDSIVRWGNRWIVATAGGLIAAP
jgi:hypothetical protein